MRLEFYLFYSVVLGLRVWLAQRGCVGECPEAGSHNMLKVDNEEDGIFAC